MKDVETSDDCAGLEKNAANGSTFTPAKIEVGAGAGAGAGATGNANGFAGFHGTFVEPVPAG